MRSEITPNAKSVTSRVLMLTLILTACEGAPQYMPVGSVVEQVEVVPTDQEDMERLAYDYIVGEGDDVIVRVEDEIRSLRPEEQITFATTVANLESLTGWQRDVWLDTVDLAAARGISFLDLSEEDADLVLNVGLSKLERDDFEEEGVLGPAYAVCIPPWVACRTASFPDRVSSGTCPGGCTSGTSWDSTSNDACEFQNCDLRLTFPRISATKIEGTTVQTRCVVQRHGTMIAERTPTSTRVLLGNGTALLCAIVIPAPAKFRVW